MDIDKIKLKNDANKILSLYPQKRSSLLPLLHLVQSYYGYIPDIGIEFCANLLDITYADVEGVVSFYSMYHTKPVGDYIVGICINTLCAVMGGDTLYNVAKKRLETLSKDKKISEVTLEGVECNAGCDYAPVIMVNWEFFDNMTPEKTVQLIDALSLNKDIPIPSRGAPLLTFKESERILAGFVDERVDIVDYGNDNIFPSIRGLKCCKNKK